MYAQTKVQRPLALQGASPRWGLSSAYVFSAFLRFHSTRIALKPFGSFASVHVLMPLALVAVAVTLSLLALVARLLVLSLPFAVHFDDSLHSSLALNWNCYPSVAQSRPWHIALSPACTRPHPDVALYHFPITVTRRGSSLSEQESRFSLCFCR